MRPLSALVVLSLCWIQVSNGQFQIQPNGIDEKDPCGYPDTSRASYKASALLNWGYGFDSLRVDLARWGQSPFVRIDSVGATVQNRPMYMMTIQDTAVPSRPRKRVWIHARTHPNEVQGTWVTNEIIKLLLSSSTVARRLRDSCVFNIMPMYNPDGVELMRPRENANGIDIESNWGVATPQPEVQALRRLFTQLMSQPNPIRVALNMHSAIACKRYFVYHAASGTSNQFATMQQNFIGSARAHFPGGFEPWTYFVSWTSGAPTSYPESWFWYNHHEAVLANTYEDKNCLTAGGFDTTGVAILLAISDYLGVSGPTSIASEALSPNSFQLEQNFPNPFNPTTAIRFDVPRLSHVTLTVYNMLGQEVVTLVNETRQPGSYEARFNASSLSSGVYFYRLQTSDFADNKKLLLLDALGRDFKLKTDGYVSTKKMILTK